MAWGEIFAAISLGTARSIAALQASVGGVNIGEMHNYGVNNGGDVASALSRSAYASYSAGQTR